MAHRAGKRVFVWTPNTREEMESLLELNVDGLITDRADVLKDLLTERGAWNLA
jgi:glycerophosphoryl diester phosphodiesterase